MHTLDWLCDTNLEHLVGKSSSEVRERKIVVDMCRVRSMRSQMLVSEQGRRDLAFPNDRESIHNVRIEWCPAEL